MRREKNHFIPVAGWVGGQIIDTHHKNQVALGLRFQQPGASKPLTPEEQIVYKVFYR